MSDKNKSPLLENPTLKDIMAALLENRNETNVKMDKLSSEIKILAKQTTSTNVKLENLSMELTKLSAEMTSNKSEINKVRSELDIVKEQLRKSSMDLNFTMQKHLANEIIISGIPIEIKTSEAVFENIKQHIVLDMNDLTSYYMKTVTSKIQKLKKYNIIYINFKHTDKKIQFI